MTNSVHGYVVVDKPVGQSSNATVQAVRRALGVGGKRGTKGGHAGTLDPFATGIVVVLLGYATRLMQLVVGHDKRYLVDVRLGAWSTTDDLVGELVPVPGAPTPTPEQVRVAVAELAGRTQQVPPQVSALHVDGQRAYRRVLRGEQLDLPSRPVRFHAVELRDYDAEAGLVQLDVRCGTGTYMRAFARDLGGLLGTGGYASALRRTEVGELTLDGAVDPVHVQPADVRPMRELVVDQPTVRLDAAALAAFSHGQFPALEPGVLTSAAPEGGLAPPLVVLGPDDAVVGIGRPTTSSGGAALLRPDAVFVQPERQGVEA